MYLAAVMSWEDVYKIMAAGAVVGMAAILCSKEPKKKKIMWKSVARGTGISGLPVLSKSRLLSVCRFYVAAELDFDFVVCFSLSDE